MGKYGNLQKHENPNPIQSWLISSFLNLADSFVTDLPVKRTLDVGSGEGFVSHALLGRGLLGFTIAVDLDAAALKRGQAMHPLLHFGQCDAYALPFTDQTFDLVICTEVLEHVDKPELLLKELRRVTCSYCLLSVPHEPFFRVANFIRGKHVRQWGNDPEHINHWGKSSFCQLVGRYFRLMKAQGTFPWFMVLASK
jgi:SAM-dependent methyltransferase